MLCWLFGRLSFQSYWSVYIACSKGLRHGDANHLFNSWTTGMPLKLIWIRIWSRQRTSDRWNCSFCLAVCMGNFLMWSIFIYLISEGKIMCSFLSTRFMGWFVLAQLFYIHFYAYNCLFPIGCLWLLLITSIWVQCLKIHIVF